MSNPLSQIEEIKDDPKVVDAAFNKTKRAFAQRKSIPYDFRVRQLKNFRDGMKAMQKELGEALEKDLGRSTFVSWMTEFLGIEEKINHALAHLREWMRDEVVDTPMLIAPGTSKIVYEPLGVILVMGSWNFPLFTTLGPLIYVIASGNCAVIKPSEFSPHSTKIIKKLVVKYLDMNCYACIEGAVEVAKACTSKRFDSIIFTGSSEKGKLVAQSAAKNLVPCILELGGKCPVVIDDSADMELAAKKVVFGRFINAGQICLSPDYVLVHYTKVDKLLPLLEKYIKEFFDEGRNVADMGRVVNDFHRNRLCELLRDHKGNVVIGNPNAFQDGNLTPTVVLNPQRDTPLMRDEIFGPILPVVPYQSIDEAIKYINDGEKPLALYYFGSQRGANARRIEKETSSGAYAVNDAIYQAFNIELPFGGVGYSGYGRYHGIDGFHAFSNKKSVLIKPPVKMYPYNQTFPPYTKERQDFIRLLIKLTNNTQRGMARQAFSFIIFVWLVQAIARGKLNKTTLMTIKNGLIQLFKILKGTFERTRI